MLGGGGSVYLDVSRIRTGREVHIATWALKDVRLCDRYLQSITPNSNLQCSSPDNYLREIFPRMRGLWGKDRRIISRPHLFVVVVRLF